MIDLKILVTGFGAFSTNDINPTEEVVSLLPESIRGNKIITAILPVVFDECFEVLKPLIEKEKPDIIISLGLAAGRTALTPERVAININDSRVADNKGNMPFDESIIDGGEFALQTTLPLRRIESILKRKHLPVSISNSAGLFVCNNVMYHTLNYIKENNLDTKAGFIHIPLMSEQVKPNDTRFNMPLYDILEGIIDSIKTML